MIASTLAPRIALAINLPDTSAMIEAEIALMQRIEARVSTAEALAYELSPAEEPLCPT